MKKIDTFAIILAAGKGTRMSKKDNKLLLTLGRSTIIEFSINTFLDHSKIKKIFLTISPNDKELFKDLLPQKIVLVEGGKRRQDSVHNALLRIMQEDIIPELVLVHDGARPFCSSALIDRVIDASIDYGAAIPVLPLVNTIRIIKNGKTSVLDREKLFSVQTPQGFRTKLIYDASTQAIKKKLEVTDDAALIEHFGKKVKTVEGEYSNIKITTPEDLDRANFILNSKKFY